jgi:hypothetical protein
MMELLAEYMADVEIDSQDDDTQQKFDAIKDNMPEPVPDPNTLPEVKIVPQTLTSRKGSILETPTSYNRNVQSQLGTERTMPPIASRGRS